MIPDKEILPKTLLYAWFLLNKSTHDFGNKKVISTFEMKVIISKFFYENIISELALERLEPNYDTEEMDLVDRIPITKRNSNNNEKWKPSLDIFGVIPQLLEVEDGKFDYSFVLTSENLTTSQFQKKQEQLKRGIIQEGQKKSKKNRFPEAALYQAKTKKFIEYYLERWLNDNIINGSFKVEKQIEEVVKVIFLLLKSSSANKLEIKFRFSKDVDFIATMLFLERRKTIKIIDLLSSCDGFLIKTTDKFLDTFNESSDMQRVSFDFEELRDCKRKIIFSRESRSLKREGYKERLLRKGLPRYLLAEAAKSSTMEARIENVIDALVSDDIERMGKYERADPERVEEKKRKSKIFHKERFKDRTNKFHQDLKKYFGFHLNTELMSIRENVVKFSSVHMRLKSDSP